MRTSVLLCLLASTFVLADSAKRKYTFKKSSNKLSVSATYSPDKEEVKDTKSKKKDETTSLPSLGFGFRSKDKLDIDIESTGAGLKFHLKWFSKTEETKEKFQFRQYMKDAIEYECSSTTCGPNNDECCPYTEGDNILATYSFGSWDPAEYTGCAVEDDECTVVFTTSDGRFSASFKLNTAGLTEGPITLGQNDIKMDITENFALTSSNSSALALRGKVDSTAKSKRRSTKTPKEDPEEVDALDVEESDSGVSSTFSWLSEIECGGAKRKVKTSEPKDAESEDGGSAKDVAWTMLKTKGDGVCVWDPAIEFKDGRFCWDCYFIFILVGVIVLCCVVPCLYFCCKKRNAQKNNMPLAV